MTKHVRRDLSGDAVVQTYMQPRPHQRQSNSLSDEPKTADDSDLADLPDMSDDHACVVSSAITLMLEARLAFSEVCGLQ